MAVSKLPSLPVVSQSEPGIAVAPAMASPDGRYGTPGAAAPLMRDFMPDWGRWHDWLRGLDLDPFSEENWRPASEVKFMPPVPEPVHIFHTFHNYDRPSSTTGKYDPPKAERVLPDLFLGASSALSGNGATVYREHGAVQFDFELEVTAVIGKTAYKVSSDEADDYVAGYTIGNDLTMHFGWWKKLREQTRLNDNIRMKNFPGYTPMGTVIVPSDIVGADALPFDDLIQRLRVLEAEINRQP